MSDRRVVDLSSIGPLGCVQFKSELPGFVWRSISSPSDQIDPGLVSKADLVVGRNGHIVMRRIGAVHPVVLVRGRKSRAKNARGRYRLALNITSVLANDGVRGTYESVRIEAARKVRAVTVRRWAVRQAPGERIAELDSNMIPHSFDVLTGNRSASKMRSFSVKASASTN